MFFGSENEIRARNHLNPSLNFTLEKEREMEQILESYKNVFLEDKEILMPDISFTRGHFKGSKVGEKLVNIIVELSKYLTYHIDDLHTTLCFSIFGYQSILIKRRVF